MAAATPVEPKAVTGADLEKAFKEYSIAEFFKKNRQMLGYSGDVRSLTTIVHEYVTNSLDACEDSRVLPEITVEVEALTAKPRHTELGIGDGEKKAFEISEEIGKAATLRIFVGGSEKKRGEDYVIKYERKGGSSVKMLIFKSAAPGKETPVSAEWAVGHLRVAVQDNGSGIPKSKVGAAIGKLLAGTKFNQRMQKRGQQGIGASYATLFAQITTGKPTHVKTSTGDYKVYECDVSIDVKRNEPAIVNAKEYSGSFKGLRVEAEFSEVAYDRSEYGVYEYLRRTALANPHAQITFIEPSKEITVFPRASKDLPKKPKPAKPHPLGLTTSDLMDMAGVTEARKISSFLTNELTKVTDDKVRELADIINGENWEKKKKEELVIDFDKHPKTLQWLQAEALVHSFQKVKFYNPDMDTLQPIGEEQIRKSLKNLLAPEHMKVVERKPKVFRGGIPFMVEAAIAYGGKAGKKEDGSTEGEIMRFANRVPLLFDSGNCAITEAVKNTDWNRYELKNIEEQPVAVFINFVSVYVPYTGAGKLAVSAEEEIVSEIRMALMECAREIAMHIHGMQKAEDEEKRRQIFFKYIEEVAECLHDITGKDKAVIVQKLRKIAEERTALAEAEDAEADAELDKVEKEAEKEIEEES
ncbi:MAG: DNA topoisomerase VI subunit B [Candidatus Micrarchaeota archaeon]